MALRSLHLLLVLAPLPTPALLSRVLVPHRITTANESSVGPLARATSCVEPSVESHEAWLRALTTSCCVVQPPAWSEGSAPATLWDLVQLPASATVHVPVWSLSSFFNRLRRLPAEARLTVVVSGTSCCSKPSGPRRTDQPIEVAAAQRAFDEMLSILESSLERAVDAEDAALVVEELHEYLLDALEKDPRVAHVFRLPQGGAEQRSLSSAGLGEGASGGIAAGAALDVVRTTSGRATQLSRHDVATTASSAHVLPPGAASALQSAWPACAQLAAALETIWAAHEAALLDEDHSGGQVRGAACVCLSTRLSGSKWRATRVCPPLAL